MTAMLDDIFTPTAGDMEGCYYGLLVAAMDEGSELIAIGPNLTARRALAAFSAYTRTVCDTDRSSHRILREDLADSLATVVVKPTSFTRGKDGWQAHPHTADGQPAAWLS